jgi:hypothetical protein
MKIDRTVLRRSWEAWVDTDLESAGPKWLQWAWTVAFAAVVAFGFTVLGFAFFAGADSARWLDARHWGYWYRVNFVISLTIALIVHLLFLAVIGLLGRARVRSLGGGRRLAFYVGLPMLGVLAGWPLGVALAGDPLRIWARGDRAGVLGGSVVLALMVSVFFFVHFDAVARRAVAERRAAEAQLRLLQAQMEPHFLFNTLANVAALIEAQPPKARAMLEAFVDYLRASLGALRRERVPLADEIGLARAYLGLQQSRMEERLRYAIDADAAALQATLPPLLLQPLVENAVRHGLEPKIDGGSVHVAARVEGRDLVVTVRDDGLGDASPAHAGNGVALQNIRARLLAHYGDRAGLEVVPASPGTCATLRVPLSAPLSDPSACPPP